MSCQGNSPGISFHNNEIVSRMSSRRKISSDLSLPYNMVLSLECRMSYLFKISIADSSAFTPGFVTVQQ